MICAACGEDAAGPRRPGSAGWPRRPSSVHRLREETARLPRMLSGSAAGGWQEAGVRRRLFKAAGHSAAGRAAHAAAAARPRGPGKDRQSRGLPAPSARSWPPREAAVSGRRRPRPQPAPDSSARGPGNHASTGMVFHSIVLPGTRPSPPGTSGNHLCQANLSPSRRCSTSTPASR